MGKGMSVEIGYEQAVREDLVAAHRRQWQRLGRAGTWWTGAERVAIAREVRRAGDCPLCTQRAAALSPYATQSEHAPTAELGAAAVDVTHRVTTDPGRLSRVMYDRARAAGLDAEHYVELIGVVVTVLSIDSFCRGIGAPLHLLPDPTPGEPSRYRPPAARMEGAWVPLIPSGYAREPEADLFDDGPGHRTGNVIRALSLVPDEVRGLKDLLAAHYVPMTRFMDMTFRRSLSRAQMELVASRVSALRSCFY
jgi:hypothetical protein